MNTLTNLNRQYEADTQARSFSYWAGQKAGARWSQSDDLRIFEFTKAAVVQVGTGDLSPLQRASRAFVGLMERQTVLGRLPGVINVPPFTSLSALTNEPTPSWVAEGAAIPVARMDFTAPTSDETKFGTIVAVAQEVLRATDDRAVNVLEAVLLRALRRSEDRLLLSADAAVLHERPAGLLAGLSPMTSGSPQDLVADIRSLWASVRNGDPDRPAFILSPTAALYLASLVGSDELMFPNLGPLGGEIFGVPALTSAGAAHYLILVDASQLAVVDHGVLVESAKYASVEMSDTPANSAATGQGATMVSAFQTDVAFLRLIRYLWWVLVTDDAAGFIELPLFGSPA